MINKNVKTHNIIMKNWEILKITKAQYEFYKEEINLKKFTDFIIINNIDTDEILFEWRCSEIKRFEKIKFDKWYQQTMFVCDWWTRHQLSQVCNCWKKFDCLWFQMKDRLNEMWYNIKYPSDITLVMQNKYINKFLL